MLLHLPLTNSAVVSRPHPDASCLEAEAGGGQLIEKRPVMGNQKAYAREVTERLQQKLARRSIKVVGRLIQNQYIGLCCKSAGNLHALLLA